MTLIAGKEDGATLSITAGMHATEYVGIVVAHELAGKIEPAKLRGNLIIAPLVNTYGVDALSLRINPIDGANLNRIFPGDPKGTDKRPGSRPGVQEHYFCFRLLHGLPRW